jgi:hypothetical protein
VLKRSVLLSLLWCLTVCAQAGLVLENEVSIRRSLNLFDYPYVPQADEAEMVILDNGFGDENERLELFPDSETFDQEDSTDPKVEIPKSYYLDPDDHGLRVAQTIQAIYNRHIKFYFINGKGTRGIQRAKRVMLEKIQNGSKARLAVDARNYEYGGNMDGTGDIDILWREFLEETGLWGVISAGNNGGSVWDGPLVIPAGKDGVTFNGESYLEMVSHVQGARVNIVTTWMRNRTNSRGTNTDLNTYLYRQDRDGHLELVAKSETKQRIRQAGEKVTDVFAYQPVEFLQYALDQETPEAPVEVNPNPRPVVPEPPKPGIPTPSSFQDTAKVPPPPPVPNPPAPGLPPARTPQAPKVDPLDNLPPLEAPATKPAPEQKVIRSTPTAPKVEATTPIDLPPALPEPLPKDGDGAAPVTKPVDRPKMPLKLDYNTHYFLYVTDASGNFVPSDHIRVTVVNYTDPVLIKGRPVAAVELLKPQGPSIMIPGDLNVPQAFTIGADISFSGKGPTLDGRDKPDVIMEPVTSLVQFTNGKKLPGVTWSTAMFAGVLQRILVYRPDTTPQMIHNWARNGVDGYGITPVDINIARQQSIELDAAYNTVSERVNQIARQRGEASSDIWVGKYPDGHYVIGTAYSPLEMGLYDDEDARVSPNDYRFFLHWGAVEAKELLTDAVTGQNFEFITRRSTLQSYAPKMEFETRQVTLKSIRDVEIRKLRKARNWITPLRWQVDAWK